MKNVDECAAAGGTWLNYPEHFDDTFNSVSVVWQRVPVVNVDPLSLSPSLPLSPPHTRQMLTMFEISYLENWVDVLWMIHNVNTG